MNAPGPRSEAAGGSVVGFDGSDPARDAVALAEALRPWAGAPHLVMVRAAAAVPEAERAAPGAEPTDQLPSRVVARSPAAGLGRIAAERHANAILLGSTHRVGLGQIYPGSVAYHLLKRSPVPVGVAPRGYAQRSESRLYVVGVAFDASSVSRAALKLAEQLSLLAADAMRVYTVLPRSTSSPASRGYATGAAVGQIRDQLAQSLHEAVAELDPAARALAVTLEGDPVAALAARSHEIDLLVVGSHGRGPLETLLQGSVSSGAVRSFACPVLAVPSSALGADAGNA